MNIKFSKTHKIFTLVIILVLFSISFFLYHLEKNTTNTTTTDILTEDIVSNLTDLWCHEVTIKHDTEAISKLFCPDGNLVGTVSQVKRKGNDIKTYFNYFAKKKGIQIIKKEYNISKVTPNVFINTAFITWFWDGLENPVVARMSFVYHGKCIFQLHSSVLPELNQDLLDISKLQ